MLRERNETYMLFFAVIDMVVTFISFWVAFGFRFFIQDTSASRFDSLDLNGYLYIGIVIMISQVAVFYNMNMYGSWKIGILKNELRGIIAGTILTILIALGVIFFLKTHRYSRLVVLYFGIVNIILISVGRALLRKGINNRYRKGKHLKSLMIIGTGENAKQVEFILQRNQLLGYAVKGFVKLKDENSPQIEERKIIGLIDDLPKLLGQFHPYHVIYASDSVDTEVLKQAINICSYEGIHIDLVPGFSELMSSQIHMESLDGIPFINLRDIPARRGANRLLKRVFDTLFSFIFIMVFSLLYILIALTIKLSSKGPILLKQERVGLNNKIFNLLKFRTMYTQRTEESDTIWTKDHDPRVTPVGRFLRKFSLDEIPQFLNVLSGKMSVVGPRPERPYWVEQFKEKYIGYMQRHGMKAGITGWAQINGLRGDTSIEERVAADIYYIENWSFFLDLKIIFLTPLKSIFDRNAY